MDTFDTLGKRIRKARLDTGMNQPEFGKAISRLTGAKIDKSLVSQWELDKIANPQNNTMLAIQAITGYAVNWLVSGQKPEKTSLGADTTTRIDIALLGRALEAAAGLKLSTHELAKVSASLYPILVESPTINAAALRQIAEHIARST